RSMHVRRAAALPGRCPGRPNALFVEVEAHGGVSLPVLGPVLGDAYLQEQMDAALEHCLQIGARRGADALDLAAALTKHDGLMSFTCDMHNLVDAHAAVRAILPFFGFDRRRIRKFLMKLPENLLARRLGR